MTTLDVYNPERHDIIYDPDDIFGRWDPSLYSAKYTLPASVCRAIAASFPTASAVPSNYESDGSEDDTIRHTHSAPPERWDTLWGLKPGGFLASDHRPFAASAEPTSRLKARPNGIDSGGNIQDQFDAFLRAHCFITPQTRNMRRQKGRDSPDCFLASFVHNSPVPDITREIRNMTLVASGGYSLVYRADWKGFQGNSTAVCPTVSRIVCN